MTSYCQCTSTCMCLVSLRSTLFPCQHRCTIEWPAGRVPLRKLQARRLCSSQVSLHRAYRPPSKSASEPMHRKLAQCCREAYLRDHYRGSRAAYSTHRSSSSSNKSVQRTPMSYYLYLISAKNPGPRDIAFGLTFLTGDGLVSASRTERVVTPGRRCGVCLAS